MSPEDVVMVETGDHYTKFMMDHQIYNTQELEFLEMIVIDLILRKQFKSVIKF